MSFYRIVWIIIATQGILSIFENFQAHGYSRGLRIFRSRSTLNSFCDKTVVVDSLATWLNENLISFDSMFLSRITNLLDDCERENFSHSETFFHIGKRLVMPPMCKISSFDLAIKCMQLIASNKKLESFEGLQLSEKAFGRSFEDKVDEFFSFCRTHFNRYRYLQLAIEDEIPFEHLVIAIAVALGIRNNYWIKTHSNRLTDSLVVPYHNLYRHISAIPKGWESLEFPLENLEVTSALLERMIEDFPDTSSQGMILESIGDHTVIPVDPLDVSKMDNGWKKRVIVLWLATWGFLDDNFPSVTPFVPVHLK